MACIHTTLISPSGAPSWLYPILRWETTGVLGDPFWGLRGARGRALGLRGSSRVVAAANHVVLAHFELAQVKLVLPLVRSSLLPSRLAHMHAVIGRTERSRTFSISSWCFIRRSTPLFILSIYT